MPTSMIAAINSEVATGRRMKSREGLMTSSQEPPPQPSPASEGGSKVEAPSCPPSLAGEGGTRAVRRGRVGANSLPVNQKPHPPLRCLSWPRGRSVGGAAGEAEPGAGSAAGLPGSTRRTLAPSLRSEEHTSELQSQSNL